MVMFTDIGSTAVFKKSSHGWGW